jgi:hypothetical protein
MGNSITYDGELSVCTADINTAKLHWNSVVSTPNAKYMCLYIKIFYLTAALEYFKYMKMPLALFPSWIFEQYDLKTHAKDGWVHLEMRPAVWGLPQAGILANKHSNANPHPLVIMSVSILRAYGTMNPDRFHSLSSSMTLG